MISKFLTVILFHGFSVASSRINTFCLLSLGSDIVTNDPSLGINKGPPARVVRAEMLYSLIKNGDVRACGLEQQAMVGTAFYSSPQSRLHCARCSISVHCRLPPCCNLKLWLQAQDFCTPSWSWMGSIQCSHFTLEIPVWSNLLGARPLPSVPYEQEKLD